MADVKISELAKTVGVSVDKLLSQIKEAGLPHVGPDELISNDDKNTLLVFLRRSHGDREATNAAPKKITLKRLAGFPTRSKKLRRLITVQESKLR